MVQEQKGCAYCRMEKPLTDKVYDDGSKFDDRRGISIDRFGKIPILKAYIKPRYFRVGLTNTCGLTNEQIEMLASNWAVEISYCPICGRKLVESKED